MTRSKKYQSKNKKEIAKRRKVYYEKNKNIIISKNALYSKKKLKLDPIFRFKRSVSALITYSLNYETDFKRNNSIFAFLNYSLEELKQHIENQFVGENSWMTWENRGVYNPETHDTDRKWQLDHIIPQADFKFDSYEHPEFKKCWALSNLRPLDARQNLLDGCTRVRHKKKIE